MTANAHFAKGITVRSRINITYALFTLSYDIWHNFKLNIQTNLLANKIEGPLYQPRISKNNSLSILFISHRYGLVLTPRALRLVVLNLCMFCCHRWHRLSNLFIQRHRPYRALDGSASFSPVSHQIRPKLG